MTTYTGTSSSNTLTGSSGADTMMGLGGNDLLTGNDGDDLLDGGTGIDTMIGGTGNDTYIVDNVGDVVTENASEGTDLVKSSISYTLGDDVENLTLTGSGGINATGNALSNILTGNSGANILNGGGGPDTLIGGGGNDTYIITSAGDTITETTSGGTGDIIKASIDYTLAANVEILTLTGSGNLDGTGNALANIINGNSGDNVLNGGAGADKLLGGAGDDTYVIDNTGDVITELGGGGTDTAQSSITYTIALNVENLTLTGASAINGVGNTGNNIITGNGAANTLDGKAGADTMIGGLGNDTYVVDGLTDVITENSGEGTDLVQSAGSYTLGDNLENLTLTGSAGVNATGNDLDNVLTGNSGANILAGGVGNDTMIGGGGNDTFIVADAGDVVTEASGGGTDTVQTALSYTLTANVEKLVLTGADNVNGTGNTLANTLTGNSGDNVLDGGTGVDTLIGGLGNDTYVVDATADVVNENAASGTDLVQASATYTLGLNLENLTLTGSSNINGTGNTLANTLTGNSGNNVLDGMSGADTMIGGTGNDTYVVDNAGDVVTENASEGTDLVKSAISYTLGTDLENLTLNGSLSINGTGNTVANIITGNSGINILDGGAGADTMIGGAGNDTYIVDNIGDVVTENVSEGTDLVKASVTYTLSTNAENLTLTGSGNINGTGNALNNVMIGNDGDNVLNSGAGMDTLDGGLGADTMIGGAANDVYVVDDTGDVVTEAVGEGTDLVQSSVTYTLGANVENLTLKGSDALDATGNALANIIYGNSGNNVIDGGAGIDQLYGGAGDDTYYVDNTSDVLIEYANSGVDSVFSSVTFGLGLNLENLTLTGSANINGTGSALDNIIIGNDGNNVLNGGTGGNDTLDGGLGADTLQGGNGNDTYIVDNIGDVVTEAASAGGDLVQASVTFTLSANVEYLELTGTDDINGTGNTLGNRLTGNDGNNVLDGGAGIDTMIGGLGDDTYVVDSSSDVVTENADEGTDTVLSSVTKTLGLNLENLTLTGVSNINGTGNALDNVITGNSGNNVIDGGVGADTMIGGAGNDTYYVDDAGDVITENAGEGTDTVNTSVTYTLASDFENLTLTGIGNIDGTGNELNNLITGNNGDNVLDGLVGADTMIGGLGNDTYVVDDVGDVLTENASAGTDLVQASITFTLATDFENLTLTGSDDIDGTGNAVANIIIGNDGNNVLDGKAGADTMTGGLGDDTYILDNVGDVVTENSDEGTDTVQTSTTYTLGANLENLTLTGIANINGTGNALDNIILGNDGNNVLDGLAGADTLTGGLGNDTYVVDDLGDTIEENADEGTDLVQASVTYTLSSDLENLTLTGSANIDGTGNELDNIILGNSGDNILDGGLGADTLTGGAGNDTYIVDDMGDIVTEGLNAGTDAVQASITYTLGSNLENLTLTGTDDIDGTGNALANAIVGNDGNNVLDGGAGADTLTGGVGDDTYVLDNAGDTVVELTGEGIDLVMTNFSYTLATDLENLTLTGSGSINATGNALDNILTGNSGNNTLDGLVGADTMIGGAGDDIYVVDDAGDSVVELDNEGTDLVRSSVSYVLSVDLENLTLTGSGNIDATGSSADNIIIGNSGNNVIDGLAGADSMSGGDGDDTYVVDDAGDVVTENINAGTDLVQAAVSIILGNNIENLTLTGTADIDGTGNALANIILGNDGNNVLDGGVGADTLTGGAGDDTYIVDNAGDVLTENSGEGIDLVQSSVSFTLGADFENLTLTGSGGINATGNDLDNLIIGNAGNNNIDGGIGADTLMGGDGGDTYTVDDAGDTVIELDAQGTDLVRASVTHTLSDYVENLTLIGSGDIDGTGNELDNVINGNSGNNVLDGLGGADTMLGGSGDDTYIVDHDGDVVTEGSNAGTDSVQSSVTFALGNNIENLTLTGLQNVDATGNNLANTIIGNDGNNVIDAGGGADTLTGGDGADTFTFQATTAFGAADTILDFNTAQNDALNIHDLLSNYDPLNQSITDYVQITDNGTDSTISIDRDGTGTGYGFTTIATLTGVTGLPDVVTLVGNGTIIV